VHLVEALQDTSRTMSLLNGKRLLQTTNSLYVVDSWICRCRYAIVGNACVRVLQYPNLVILSSACNRWGGACSGPCIRHFVKSSTSRCQHPIILAALVGNPHTLAADRCDDHCVTRRLVLRKKREAKHLDLYSEPSDCPNLARRSWDLEVWLPWADAEFERGIHYPRVVALSGEAQKVQRRRDEVEGTWRAEIVVAVVVLAEAVVAGTIVDVAASGPAKLEGSCWAAAARRLFFHIAVAARIEEGSTEVVAASLERIREAAHSAVWVVGLVEGRGCSLCGCAEEVSRGGGAAASGHVSFPVTSALVPCQALALSLCPCCICEG
jgi:hypothetical protein